MPIYEYQCIDCGIINEALQKVSDPLLVKCDHCSGKLKKLISQNSFHLKGSGWYVTDYTKKSEQKNSSTEIKKDSSADTIQPKKSREEKIEKKSNEP